MSQSGRQPMVMFKNFQNVMLGGGGPLRRRWPGSAWQRHGSSSWRRSRPRHRCRPPGRRCVPSSCATRCRLWPSQLGTGSGASACTAGAARMPTQLQKASQSRHQDGLEDLRAGRIFAMSAGRCSWKTGEVGRKGRGPRARGYTSVAGICGREGIQKSRQTGTSCR